MQQGRGAVGLSSSRPTWGRSLLRTRNLGVSMPGWWQLEQAVAESHPKVNTFSAKTSHEECNYLWRSSGHEGRLDAALVTSLTRKLPRPRSLRQCEVVKICLSEDVVRSALGNILIRKQGTTTDAVCQQGYTTFPGNIRAMGGFRKRCIAGVYPGKKCQN